MATWNPWVVDSGWYWQLFNRDAPDSANLVGIFAGPASQLIGAHMSGVGIYTAPADKGEQPRFGISLVSHRRGPDARVFLRSRWGWGLFVGTKGADLKPATEIQPIAQQMNLHGGINLEKIHRYTLDFPDPPQGYGAMYMPKPAVEALIAKLRAEKDFFTWAYNAETMGRPLIDFWADTTGKQAEKVTGEIESLARTFLDHFVNGDGIYAMPTHYCTAASR
jgi:hypothetical protein